MHLYIEFNTYARATYILLCRLFSVEPVNIIFMPPIKITVSRNDGLYTIWSHENYIYIYKCNENVFHIFPHALNLIKTVIIVRVNRVRIFEIKMPIHFLISLMLFSFFNNLRMYCLINSNLRMLRVITIPRSYNIS